MNQRRKIKFGVAFFPMMVIAISLALGLVLKLLWNAILTPVLRVQPITFWQALGMFIISRILFGGFYRPRAGWKGKPGWGGSPEWRQKWMNMSEEERARFRQEWQNRCGHRKNKQE